MFPVCTKIIPMGDWVMRLAWCRCMFFFCMGQNRINLILIPLPFIVRVVHLCPSLPV